MSSPLRVALIGTGAMGSLHARVVSQSILTELACVVDPDIERGEAAAKSWGSVWKPDLESFEGIDAVIVATPSATHLEWGLRAIEDGLPVLVEKPLSQDLSEAERMIERSETLDVPMMCGLLERFNPAVLKMMEIVEEPIHLGVVRHSPHTPRILTGVGYDLAIHDVDLALRLAQDVPSEVSALVSTCHPTSPPGSEDIAEIALSFSSGLLATVSASRVSQRKVRTVQVSEVDRLIDVDLLRRDITVYRHVGADFLDGRETGYRQQTVIDIPAILDSREPLVAQLEHFVQLCNGQIDAASERNSILPSHRVLDEAMRSARRSDRLIVQ